jgi:hypothetical protein
MQVVYNTHAMSKRLQAVLDESELRDIRLAAQAHHTTVAEWVRQALRKERREQPTVRAEKKLQCVREAATRNYPTADIDEMLGDIERGRTGSGNA